METYGINARGTSYLGLDPGVTTGWAIIDKAGQLVGQGDFDEEVLEEGLDELVRGIHRSQRKIVVVIERMPPGSAGKLSRKLERVRGAINRVIREVYDLPTIPVGPGEWKQSRVAKITRWPDPFKSDHARDAATMALYIADKEKRRANRK